MHLTALNSHVSLILEMSASKAQAPGWHLPRMASPAAAAQQSDESAAITGISSFAFQGTNAHALLQQVDSATATVPAPAAGLTVLVSQRVWVAPPIHALLQMAAATGSGRFARRQSSAMLALDAGLGVPKLAFLWQHSILGMAVFPATAFLEMAAGATRQLLNCNDLSDSALRTAVFATPLTLPTAGAAAVRVRCSVQVAAGTFEVSSAATAGAQHRTHFYASLSTTQPVAIPARASARAEGTRAALAALITSSQASVAARLSVAEVSVPGEQLGMTLHPAVAEAAVHVAATHQPRHHPLRVAARMEAVLMAQPLTDKHVRVSSLVAPKASAAGGAHQEQQLVGSAGVAMLMAGVETRRLVAKVRTGQKERNATPCGLCVSF
jgi:hypothetical protein